MEGFDPKGPAQRGGDENHPLLGMLLAAMPPETQRQQTSRFCVQPADFEFGTWVPRAEIEPVAAQAMDRGFMVWANVDGGSAFLYGAKRVGPDAASAIAWLRGITVRGQTGQALWRRPGREPQLIRFDSTSA